MNRISRKNVMTALQDDVLTPNSSVGLKVRKSPQTKMSEARKYEAQSKSQKSTLDSVSGLSSAIVNSCSEIHQSGEKNKEPLPSNCIKHAGSCQTKPVESTKKNPESLTDFSGEEPEIVSTPQKKADRNRRKRNVIVPLKYSAVKKFDKGRSGASKQYSVLGSGI